MAQFYPGTSTVAENRRKFMNPNIVLERLRGISYEDVVKILGHKAPGEDYPNVHPPLDEMDEPNDVIRDMVVPLDGAKAGDRIRYIQFTDSMYFAPVHPFVRSRAYNHRFRGVDVGTQAGNQIIETRERDLEKYSKQLLEQEWFNPAKTSTRGTSTLGYSVRLEDDGIMFDILKRQVFNKSTGNIEAVKNQIGDELEEPIVLGKPLDEETIKVKTTIYRKDNVAYRYDDDAVEIVHRIHILRSQGGFCPESGKSLKIGSDELDNVKLTVISPYKVQREHWFTIEVCAYLEQFYDQVESLATNNLNTEKIYYKTKGPIILPRHKTLKLILEIENAKIEDKTNQIVWNGKISNADFRACIPQSVEDEKLPGTIFIYLYDLEIQRIYFEIQIGDKQSEVINLPKNEKINKKAFASYSRKDWHEKVMPHIHGMEKAAPHLEIFIDVVELRSNDNWKERLMNEIESLDVFYLFWSKNASESKWVDIEWRCALKKRGLDVIDPIPLESPENFKIPKELADKHFGDKILYIKL